MMMMGIRTIAGFLEHSRFRTLFPNVIELLLRRTGGCGVVVGAKDVEERLQAIAKAAVAFVVVLLRNGSIQREVAGVPEVPHPARLLGWAAGDGNGAGDRERCAVVLDY